MKKSKLLVLSIMFLVLFAVFSAGMQSSSMVSAYASGQSSSGLYAINLTTYINSGRSFAKRQVVQTIRVDFDDDVSGFAISELQGRIERNILNSVTDGYKRLENSDNDEYIEFMYGKTFEFSESNDRQFRLGITFENIYSYAYFNQIDIFGKRLIRLDGTTYFLVDDEYGVTTTSNLFIRRRYVSIANPFSQMFTEDGRTPLGDILAEIQSVFGASDNEVTLIFSQDFTARRSTSSAFESRRFIDGWRHYFGFLMDEQNEWEDIVLMDRLPNTPIWYGVGVGATVIFMLIIWVVFKPRKQVFDIIQDDVLKHENGNAFGMGEWK